MPELEHDHSVEAIQTRLSSVRHNYVRDWIYGGIDGAVTTFAIVSGVAGAQLSATIVLILGFANLFADGFAMAVGSYLSNKSEHDNYDKHKRTEYYEIENFPEIEKQEVRDIYRAKGFEGELLEQVVAVITKDKDRWADDMPLSLLGTVISKVRSPQCT